MNNFSIRGFATVFTLICGSLVPQAMAAVVTVSGSGPSPLGDAITLNIDGANSIGFGLDVSKPLIFGEYTSTLDEVSNYTGGARAAWIFENYGGVAWAGMAVQLAIWVVMNDGGDGLSAGSVQVDESFPGLIRDFADTMVTQSLNQSGSNSSVLVLQSGLNVDWQPLIVGAQSFASVSLSGGDEAEVPEPGTWMMVVAGLALGGFCKRR